MGKSLLPIIVIHGVSRPTLDRAFAAELGTSIAQVVIRQRIARAKIMFRKTKLTIAEVASALGFCNGSHLSNVFRRIAGMTPGAYRHAVADS